MLKSIITSIVVAFFLFSCTPTYHTNSTTDKPTTMEIGKPTAPPVGWVDYCKRHPEDPQCDEDE